VVIYFILPQPSNLLQSLKYANVIIMDEMSMMISTMLCAIKQRLKQAQDNINPFANVSLLLVGNLAQLSAICKHYLKKIELYCKLCHISMASCWSNASHHSLQTSMRHITNPIFLQF